VGETELTWRGVVLALVLFFGLIALLPGRECTARMPFHVGNEYAFVAGTYCGEWEWHWPFWRKG